MPGGQWIVLHQGSRIRNFRGVEGCAVPENICNLYLYILCVDGLRYWILESEGIVVGFFFFFLPIAIVINHYNEETTKIFLKDAA